MKHFLRKVCWLVVVFFVFTGCKGGYEQGELASKPEVESTVVTNTYARAIKATGGYEAWVTTTEMEFDSVVTFYESGGSLYLTGQHHEILPWANSIRISATEPPARRDRRRGKEALGAEVVWELREGGFKVSKGREAAESLPVALSERAFAEAILYITTAPIRFLDKSVSFIEGAKAVKKEGLWYYPIERVSNDVRPYWPKVVFYQNRESSLVDMIWFSIVSEGTFLSFRGFDYYEAEDTGVLVPTKVEISRTDSRGVVQERLVQIDFK